MSNRASFGQLTAMVDFMEKHPQLAQGTLKNLEGRSTSKRLYNQLTLILNAMSGVKKSPKGWSKSNRASFGQLTAMVDFMEKHPQLAQGTLKNLEGRSTSKRLYNQLTLILNAMSGVKKSPKGWSKSNRASFGQLTAMVDFMEKHPQLAQGTLKNLEGRSTSKRLYNQLTLILNAMSGVKKSPKGWSKYWSDKKFAIKKTNDITKLSLIDKRMYDICFLRNEEFNAKDEIKKEDGDSSQYGDDDEDVKSDKSDMDEQVEETPINFVEQPIMDVEERQTLLMEKLVKVMADQSTALSQLAHASQLQASAMDKLADASQIQARALDRIATSFESIGSSMGHVRHSMSSIDNNLKRIYTPTT